MPTRNRTVKSVQCRDDTPSEREFVQYQSNVDDAVARAINYDPAYGTLIRGVTLTAATVVKVGHGLGHIPQDCNVERIARSGAGTVPAVSVESMDATFVNLFSSAAGQCNLRIW